MYQLPDRNILHHNCRDGDRDLRGMSRKFQLAQREYSRRCLHVQCRIHGSGRWFNTNYRFYKFGCVV